MRDEAKEIISVYTNDIRQNQIRSTLSEIPECSRKTHQLAEHYRLHETLAMKLSFAIRYYDYAQSRHSNIRCDVDTKLIIFFHLPIFANTYERADVVRQNKEIHSKSCH